jgi:hypothetical protein
VSDRFDCVKVPFSSCVAINASRSAYPRVTASIASWAVRLASANSEGTTEPEGMPRTRRWNFSGERVRRNTSGGSS